MLKNKFTIIALIAILIFSLTIPIVRAENETDVENQIVVAEPEHSEDAHSSEAHGETSGTITADMKKSDVYITGDEVTIDYVVDGNLFVMAKTVNINSQIGGDAFIIAGKINVGEQGYIFSNLFALSQELNISGVVYDLYTCSQNTTINGYIYRDIKVLSNTLNLNGTVGRNAFVSAPNINFAKSDESEELVTSGKSMIYGDLNYASPNELKINCFKYNSRLYLGFRYICCYCCYNLVTNFMACTKILIKNRLSSIKENFTIIRIWNFNNRSYNSSCNNFINCGNYS